MARVDPDCAEARRVVRRRKCGAGSLLRRDAGCTLLPEADETLIQVFYTADGVLREEASVVAGVEQGGWREVRINLPAGASAASVAHRFHAHS